MLVADDPSLVRAGFRMLLSGEPDIEVVAEASNGLEAVDKAARFDPAVVLMDIRMPELDGLEATRRILAADASARVLILTTFDLDEYVYEALRAGASGFVLKDDPPEQLIAAIHTVAAGDALLSPSITKRVIRQFTRIPRAEPSKELEELTARELEILRLIAGGRELRPLVGGGPPRDADAGLVGEHHDLHAVAQPELLEHVGDVRLDGRLADVELRPDLCIREALREEA